jgi:selenocysteine-specific elongation factor
VALLVREARYGAGLPELVARLGERAEAIESEAGRMDALVVLREPQTWLLDRDWLSSARERVAAAVSAFHRAQPLQPGAAKSDLAARELPGAPSFVADAVLRGEPRLAVEGDLVRLASHRAQFREDESTALARIEAAFRDAGLAVPSLAEVLAGCGVDPARARALLQILLRERRLVRVGEDLVFHESAVGALRELLSRHKGERFSVPQFKDWTGVSRKYAIPLLEFLDRERATRRDGGERIVL